MSNTPSLTQRPCTPDAVATLPVVLRDPRILLIGGGNVAYQKAKVLRRNAVRFDMIAVACGTDMLALVPETVIRAVTPADCALYTIIIDATGNPGVASMLQTLKHRHGFLLNVVDAPEKCDFYFAALIERGPVKVAVSSGGASPTIAQTVRDKIGRMLPHSLAELGRQTMHDRQAGVIRPDAVRAETDRRLGRVYLIGCGPGDVDLLTLKAHRLILTADVVFFDALLGDGIKALIPPTTRRICVGKRKGSRCVDQETINTWLIRYAKKGLEVARLKAGDPYIFGRGAEEALAIAAGGIRVDVIPGISSAIAGPLCAGIAPTARGYAANFSVVSAHLAGDVANLAWIELLKLPYHTTIVLMGVTRAEEIAEAACRAGISPKLPCAVISNASRPNQQCTTGTLATLPQIAADAARPALIVFGDVVYLQNDLPRYIASPTECSEAYLP